MPSAARAKDDAVSRETIQLKDKHVSGDGIFTNNRIAWGVSAGWVKEEFDLLGIDFKDRGRRLDEVIACMQQLHGGETCSHQGEFFNHQDLIMSPVPGAKVPVWVGGKSKAA